MRAIYSGIDLGAIETHYANFEPVFDDSGVDYLYTKFTGAWRAVVNGQAEVLFPTKGRPFNGPAMSYAFADSGVKTAELTTKNQSGAIGFVGRVIRDKTTLLRSGFDRDNPKSVVSINGNPPAGSGLDAAAPSRLRRIIRVSNAAPLTIATVRHRLMTPRGKLWVFSGQGQEVGAPDPNTPDPPEVGVLLLESPNGKSVCDCKNGPIPHIFSIQQSLGDANSIIVDFGIETYFNEADLNGVEPTAALISNRFSQVHQIPLDGYTKIQTKGTAIFRTDLVYQLQQSPDSIRSRCFFPIMQGFTREIDYVEGRMDVTGIEYGFTDTQKSVNFVAGPYAKAAEIAAVHRQAISIHADVFGGALSATERAINLIAQRKFATQRDDDGRRKPAPKRNALPSRLIVPGGG